MVSSTPINEVVPGHVFMALPDDLRDGALHGLETAWCDESVILHGGPGCGKSTEAIGRLAAYAGENDLSPHDVSIVTYRSSLAREVRRKVKSWAVFPGVEWSPDEGPDPDRWITTGHAAACRASGFLDRIDEDRSEYAGMVDSEAARAFCDEYGIEFNGGPYNDSEWDAFHALYTYCKCNLLDVGEYTHLGSDDADHYEYLDGDELEGPVESDELAYRMLQEFRDVTGDASFETAVDMWETWKVEHDCHDYYEQLEAGLVGDLPGTEYVIIDEMHDAYRLMSLLFERWIDAADTAVIAGDPFQVCNAFAGADPSVITDLPMRVEAELPVVRLPKSHRVPDEHFAAARRVLDEWHNAPVLETAGRGEIRKRSPDEPARVQGRDGWQPMPYGVDGSPAALYDEYGPDIMFLARARYLVDGVGACLDAAGIIYRSQDTVAGNWSRRLTILSALETLARADGPVGLSIDAARVLLEHTDERLLAESRGDALRELAEIEQDQEYGDRQDVGVPASTVSDWVETQWWAVMGQGRDSITNLVYLDEHHNMTRESGRDETAMQRAWDRYDPGNTAFGSFPDKQDVDTKLWTMHASKGDEAEHVAVYTGVTGRIRDSVREYDDEAANEARTWYVALTRAKQSLHIVRDAFDAAAGDYDQLPDDLVDQARREAADRRASGSETGGEPA